MSKILKKKWMKQSREANIEEVKEWILSQEEPDTNEKPSEITSTMDVSESSVCRSANRDLGYTT